MRLTCPVEAKSFKNLPTFFFWNIHIPSHQNLELCVVKKKKSKKNRKWRRLHGEKSKGMSYVPWRQQKAIFTHVCDFYLYTFSTLFLHIYRLWGGGKNHLHQHLRLTPGAKQWYFIPYHSEGHYLSTTSVPSSSRDLTYTHSHTHVNAITWQDAHTIHFHPASIVDSILCKAGTEVQVGRGKWRGGTFPEGVSWYVIVLVSTQ